MRSTFRSVSLAALVTLLIGGCPRSGVNILTPANSSPTTSPAGGSGSTTAGNTQTSATDALAAEFPTCNQVAQVDAWTQEVLQLVNQARAANGQDPVVWNGTLAAQAEKYACEMIHYNFFAHKNPATGTQLSDRTAEFGYEYTWVGENLAAGQRSPTEVVEAWLNSPCHRKNLLHPAFTELGVGLRFGGEYGYYWVQEFGRPLSDGAYTGPPFEVPGCPSD